MENTEQHKKNWYDKIYKKILIVPALLLLLSIIYLINFYNKNGDLIYKDVTLTGGTTVSIFDANLETERLKNFLTNEFSDVRIRTISDFATGKQKGVVLETNAEPKVLKSSLENFLGYNLTQENSSFEFSSAAISKSFYEQLRIAILFTFLSMAIVVFLIFRSFIPSIAVIISAFADIIMTIALVNILGIKLSFGGVIAFLMIIGYSVDTDILLTNMVLRKKDDTINKRIFSAFKTGLTMSLTSMAAILAAFLIVGNLSETLRQIFLILIIGLSFDNLNTWVTNASIIKWYAESKEEKK